MIRPNLNQNCQESLVQAQAHKLKNMESDVHASWQQQKQTNNNNNKTPMLDHGDIMPHVTSSAQI
jgi:hypothetical protein